MTSSNDMASGSEQDVAGAHQRPSRDLVAALRRGKEELRRERQRLPLREKVRQVMELQRFAYPLLTRQRAPEPWMRPWEIEP